jgi:hypothetical protein
LSQVGFNLFSEPASGELLEYTVSQKGIRKNPNDLVGEPQLRFDIIISVHRRQKGRELMRIRENSLLLERKKTHKKSRN